MHESIEKPWAAFVCYCTSDNLHQMAQIIRKSFFLLDNLFIFSTIDQR